ncbi:MAG: hypothetical protein EPN69_01130 [Rhodanobacter sp.]|nr:MAG: hypothetical protein EPN71_13525 [Rhodanobacter sp.]TAL99238.1 MAG: hypothetical protein EPN69_01130 [Rhodanobacter sp.]TAM42271.1 MAG: hypothetical protein EPN58_03505 [Rhodanobacter sp.]
MSHGTHRVSWIRAAGWRVRLIALERKQGKEDLEQRVQLRTAQLAEANRGLQLEILSACRTN